MVQHSHSDVQYILLLNLLWFHEKKNVRNFMWALKLYSFRVHQCWSYSVPIHSIQQKFSCQWNRKFKYYFTKEYGLTSSRKEQLQWKYSWHRENELDPFGKQILEQVQRAVKWEINTVVLIQEKLPPFKYRCQNVSYSCNKLSNNTKSKGESSKLY